MQANRAKREERPNQARRIPVGLLLVVMLACSDTMAPENPDAATSPFLAVVTSRVSAPLPEAYVSLPPEALPGGSRATLRITRTGFAMTVSLIEGGFDPVALPAAEGDTITISVVTSTGTLSTYIVVPRRSRPTIVRTSPPKGKRDVALNARVAIVFSEPIDPGSLTEASIQLLNEGSAVPGELRFVDPARTIVEFVPAGLLEASSEYELLLTDDIRDLEGATLAPVSVRFQTGSTLLAPVATVVVVLGVTHLEVPQTAVMSAVMRDAAGNVLVGRTVTWTTSDPALATVEPYTGNPKQHHPSQWSISVITAVAAGGPVTITATSEGKSASAQVTVTSVPPATFGRIAVSVVTSGTDLDPDGYTAHVLSGDASTVSFPLSINGSATSPIIAARTYHVMLETGENCTVAGGATRQAVVTDGATTAIAFDVTCAPPSQLAFVRDEHIFLARTNGTGLVQLTSTGHNADPVWSPDGTRIAFTSDRGGRWDIYVMNADGSNVIPLTHTGYNVEPTWSPDGQRIAFMTIRSGSADVFVVSAAGNGTSATPLVTQPGMDAQPAWSPGGKIAYVSDWRAYDGLYDLYVVNADGSGITPLLVGPFFANEGLTFYFQPAWSPDGSRIAVNVCEYAWDDCFPVSTVMVANADGSGLTALAPGGGYSHPTWSPDGRTLAFSRSTCRSCAASLHFVRTDGTQEGTILTDGRSPSWRPQP